jgi:PhnB protein
MSATASIARPQVLGGVAPYLMLDGASRAAQFYQRAFGAEEVARQPADSKGSTLHLQVDDVEARWQRAVDAGAHVVMPLQLMFWGDLYGTLRDPFGVDWSVATSARSA